MIKTKYWFLFDSFGPIRADIKLQSWQDWRSNFSNQSEPFIWPFYPISVEIKACSVIPTRTGMGWGGWSEVAAQSIRVIGYQLQLWYEIRDDTDNGLWLVNHRQYWPLIGWPVTRGSDKRSDAEINQHQKSSSPRHGAHSKDQISWYLRFSKISTTDPDQSFPAYSQHSPELSLSVYRARAIIHFAFSSPDK